MGEFLALFAPLVGILGLWYARKVFKNIVSVSIDSEKMRELSDAIYEGARVYLKKEYSWLLLFIAIVFSLLCWKISFYTAIAFIFGAFCSMLAGFFGMESATRANVRTTQAAVNEGQGKAFSMAFSGGNVMGLCVASLGLLGLGILFEYIVFGSNPSCFDKEMMFAKLFCITWYSFLMTSISWEPLIIVDT